MERELLPSLTGVRFFLALWVVLYHITLPAGLLPLATFGLFAPVIHSGYIAVGIFFVLSGFVLSHSYSSPIDTRQFLTARFARIYPVYLCGLLAMAALERTNVRPRGISLLASGVLLQAWFPQFALDWNTPGWSLSVETFFYLTFPLVIPVVTRSNLSTRRLLLIGCFLWGWACLVPTIVVTSGLAVPLTNFVKTNPILRLSEFLFGMLLYQLYLRIKAGRPNRPFGGWLYGLGALGMCGVLFFSGSMPYLLLHDGLLLPFYGLLVLGLALSGRVLSHPVIVFLGNASYAMYILQDPLLRMLYTNAAHGWFAHLGEAASTAVYIGLLIVISSFTFHFVEVPLNRTLKKKLQPKGARQMTFPTVYEETGRR